MEGLPVEGFCVVAGIPEKAVEIIEELKHVAILNTTYVIVSRTSII